MKLALVYPPLADPTQPYSALPALTAHLRSTGRTEVLQLDANIEFVRQVFTGDFLGAAVEKLEGELAALEPTSTEGPSAERCATQLRALLKAPMVVAGIDSAISDLGRREVFRDLRRLDRAMRLVHEAIEILSASCFPHDMSFGNSGDPGLAEPAALAALARDETANPFYEFLNRHTVGRLEAARPDAIGISITYRKQLVPAITLALLIRGRLSGVPVIFGGNIVSQWYDRIEKCPEIFAWCHYLIPFEGESALERLLAALDAGTGLQGVPNLVYPRHGEIRKNRLIHEDLNRLPTPDYRGLPLELYLAPQPVFLLYASRGCYWSRCNFCSVSPAMRGGYRVRHPDLVHGDIALLRRRHGAECISFADDCVSPSALKALASRLKASGRNVSWQCEVRFEKALSGTLLSEMKDAGCVNLIFGLESYSPRVLELMDKGVEHPEIARILSDCRRLGIACNLQFFFGFPGETAAEAATTADFVSSQMHGAMTFSFGVFELQKGAPAELNPEAFGIAEVAREDRPLAVKFDYSPAPAHAAESRLHLRRRWGERAEYHHAGLSINSHTLIFLHESGVEALGKLYRRPPAEGPGEARLDNIMESRLQPGPHQSVRSLADCPGILSDEGLAANDGQGPTFLLYDHDLDRTVEASGLALWVLRNLDGTKTPTDLVAQLAAETDSNTRTVRPVVRDVVEALGERGFLVPAQA